jgi:hypothetical protein
MSPFRGRSAAPATAGRDARSARAAVVRAGLRLLRFIGTGVVTPHDGGGCGGAARCQGPCRRAYDRRGVAAQDSRTRRAAAIGAATLLVLAAVALAARGCGGEGGPAQGDLAVPAAGELTRAPAIGVALRGPDGWGKQRGRRSLRFRSPDRSTLLSVSLPPRARRSAALLRDARAALKRGYRDVRLGRSAGRTLAGLPAVSAAASATTGSGDRVQILLAAVQGRRRAWLVQVFSAPGRQAGRRLVEAQVALGTIRLRG